MSNLTTRAEYGNLPAYTDPNGIVSPAEYGVRAMDASGNLIFDSIGVAGVMQVLAQVTTGGSTFTPAGPVTGTTILSQAFTLTRQVHVLTFARCVMSTTVGGAFCYANLLMDGSFSSPDTHHFGIAGNLAGATTSNSAMRVDVLGPGSHTASITMDVDSGITTFCFNFALNIFQLGA